MRSGWARVEITPRCPVPLAGYTHLSERISESVRDPLFVRAIGFDDGFSKALLIVYDLLLVTDEMHSELARRLKDTGAFVIVSATHTHSSMGGLWDSFLAKLFMGKHRPWVVNNLIESGEKAAREALSQLQEASVRSASVLLPGLNGNRRDPRGPKDEELTVLSIIRESDEALVVSYPAHPVIVAERAHHTISADFPGEVVRILEQDVSFAMFVSGALGGVDVLFPTDKNITCDENIRMMAQPIANSALNIARVYARPGPMSLAIASEELVLGNPDSRPFFEDEFISRFDLPLRLVLNRLVSDVPRVARVRGMRVGNWAVVGTPADLGVSLALKGKEMARQKGILDPMVASQCDGYIGYVHFPEEYQKAPPKSHLGMAHYENAMNFFGRSTGIRLLQAMERVFTRLSKDIDIPDRCSNTA